MDRVGSFAVHSAGLALRWRYLLLAVWVGGWCAAFYSARTDWLFFEMGGRILLNKGGHYPITGGPLHLYADIPVLQIGPPAFAVTALTQLLDPLPGRILAIALMAALGLVCVRALESAAASFGIAARQREPTALLGGLVFLVGWALLAGRQMHLDDVLALTTCAVAVWAISRDRGLFAGVMLGLAAASKPWAVAVVPLLFALPRRQWATSALATLVAAVACWAPFLVAAPDSVWALAGFHIPLRPDSTPALFLPPYSEAPTGLRLMQFGGGIAFAGFAVWGGRWWLAPLLGFALRVALDPATWPYYYVAVVLGALFVDFVAERRRVPWLTGFAAATLWCLPWIAHGHVGALLRLAALVVIAVLAWPARSPLPRLRTDVHDARVNGDPYDDPRSEGIISMSTSVPE